MTPLLKTDVDYSKWCDLHGVTQVDLLCADSRSWFPTSAPAEKTRWAVSLFDLIHWQTVQMKHRYAGAWPYEKRERANDGGRQYRWKKPGSGISVTFVPLATPDHVDIVIPTFSAGQGSIAHAAATVLNVTPEGTDTDYRSLANLGLAHCLISNGTDRRVSVYGRRRETTTDGLFPHSRRVICPPNPPVTQIQTPQVGVVLREYLNVQTTSANCVADTNVLPALIRAIQAGQPPHQRACGDGCYEEVSGVALLEAINLAHRRGRAELRRQWRDIVAGSVGQGRVLDITADGARRLLGDLAWPAIGSGDMLNFAVVCSHDDRHLRTHDAHLREACEVMGTKCCASP